MTVRISAIKPLIRAAAVAVAAAGVLTLSTAPAFADPTPTGAPTSVSQAQLERQQGWLKIYKGTAPTNADSVQLKVVTDGTIGQHVVDKDGRSLYRFDKDTAKPSVSNCSGDCATTWSPMLVNRGQSLYVDGIDPVLTGFIERADGTCQLTVGGWPVYYFSKDKKAGDLLGQGVGGTWFAVAPNGGKALAK
ncbi:hypothetical protein AB0N05_20975 [Nocardia sp. NPDC051030]|uniref:hypothetical protein n=1 Tax=Nocardia sp. NPDC051030 TaxID=3155162 RepID=UPI00342A8510